MEKFPDEPDNGVISGCTRQRRNLWMDQVMEFFLDEPDNGEISEGPDNGEISRRTR